MKTKTTTINVSSRFSLRLAPTLVVAAVFILSVAAQLTYAISGDLYESDLGSGNIYEFTPGGTRSTFASGLNGPTGLAFDSSGNLFAADLSSGNIYEFTPGGTRSTFASRAVGLFEPEGLAFDSAGNLFVTDLGGAIFEFTPGGTRSVFAYLRGPRGLAFDSAGNLFVTDLDGNIYEFTPGGTRSTFASGLSNPFGLAFNVVGNLFEADTDSGNIYEFTPVGTRSTFASGLNEPFFLAFAPTPTPTPTPTPFPGGGNFVIGDRNAVVGNHVTFWGAQWANLNSLSGGPAPASFIGFADSTSPNPPLCGGAWTSDTGNSSGPPSSLPPFITVIAASSITQSGSVISGNIPEMVIVQTDPGYMPDPGHPGTGTVVAVFCLTP
jgi:sugar lactone lactonase YvrE